jgi:hypothetical protein
MTPVGVAAADDQQRRWKRLPKLPPASLLMQQVESTCSSWFSWSGVWYSRLQELYVWNGSKRSTRNGAIDEKLGDIVRDAGSFYVRSYGTVHEEDWIRRLLQTLSAENHAVIGASQVEAGRFKVRPLRFIPWIDSCDCSSLRILAPKRMDDDETHACVMSRRSTMEIQLLSIVRLYAVTILLLTFIPFISPAART